jgi:hypothetical protein
VALLAPLLIFLVQEERQEVPAVPAAAGLETAPTVAAPAGADLLGTDGPGGDEAVVPFDRTDANIPAVNGPASELPTPSLQSAVADPSRPVESGTVGSSNAAQVDLAGSAAYPDLGGIDREDRRSIELACVMERGDGPAVYNRCLREHLRTLSGNSHPDMSSLVGEDRRTVELACVMARGEGPSAYNGCLRVQLEALSQNARPDLSGVHREDRRSIELACIMERGEGAAAYHGCLRSQLRSLRQN